MNGKLSRVSPFLTLYFHWIDAEQSDFYSPFAVALHLCSYQLCRVHASPSQSSGKVVTYSQEFDFIIILCHRCRDDTFLKVEACCTHVCKTNSSDCTFAFCRRFAWGSRKTARTRINNRMKPSYSSTQLPGFFGSTTLCHWLVAGSFLALMKCVTIGQYASVCTFSLPFCSSIWVCCRGALSRMQ